MKHIFILVSLILLSCGARKVNIQKTDIKKDSVVETKVLVTTIENKKKTDSTNIITNIDNSEITITPIDTTKEIIVEGKTYKNVVLKIKKNKVNTLYTNNKTESNNKRVDSVATIKVNKTQTISYKNKTIDKKANYLWILWLLLLILILYLLWRNRLSLLKLL
jgi:hypothetical protein